MKFLIATKIFLIVLMMNGEVKTDSKFSKELNKFYNHPNYKKYLMMMQFRFWFLTEEEDTDSVLINNLKNNDFFKQKWLENTPLKIIIHGYRSSAQQMPSIVEAYLHGTIKYNIITVDWSAFSNSRNYIKVTSMTVKIGMIIGKYIKELVNGTFVKSNDIHVIGASIGAHVAGACGRVFLEITNKTVARITGLDPVSPGYKTSTSCVNMFENEILCKDDAAFVDVIHSSANLGITFSIGHADFYPINNSDGAQPNCCWVCSTPSDECVEHELAYSYYIESVRSEKAFESVQCTTKEEFLNGRCNNNLKSNMGHHADPNKHGDFYLWTNESKPFSRT